MANEIYNKLTEFWLFTNLRQANKWFVLDKCTYFSYFDDMVFAHFAKKKSKTIRLKKKIQQIDIVRETTYCIDD